MLEKKSAVVKMGWAVGKRKGDRVDANKRWIPKEKWRVQ